MFQASEMYPTMPHPSGVPTTTTCISVGVLRASGLQTAAAALAKQDRMMQYPAEVGVNAYARVKLSFLQSQVSDVI